MPGTSANQHVSDNPLVIEYDRQQVPVFPYRTVATERLFAALHEAGHAAVALRHTMLGNIRIPWRNPLSAIMHDAVGAAHTADVYFAGHVLNSLLLGPNDFAHHDGVAGMRALCEFHELDPARSDGLEVKRRAAEIIRELEAYLSSPETWPRIECLACEAMKHECLTAGDYRRAAIVSGFVRVGPVRQNKISRTLAKFHHSPAELLVKLGEPVVAEWRVLLQGGI